MSIENKVTLQGEQPRGWLEKRVVVGASAVGIGVLVMYLSLACGNGGSAEPIFTPQLEPHNVILVRINDEDVTGDTIVDIRDARAQKGIEWSPGLDFNFDRIIDDRDVKLIEGDVCKLPVEPKYDINGDGHVTEEIDVAIVAKHAKNQEIVRDEPNPDARIDQLEDGGWTLEKGERVFRIYYDDAPKIPDRFCKATPTPDTNPEQ